MAFYGVNYWKNNALEQNAYSLLKKWSVLLHSKKKKKRFGVSSFVLQKKQRCEKTFPNLKSIFFK